jgi:alpha-tubulin suppressor-like RCC1 family protein
MAVSRSSISRVFVVLAVLWVLCPACSKDTNDCEDCSDAGQDSGTEADGGSDTDTGPGDEAIWVSAGDNHTCAVIEGGTVKCWGDGNWGQLGYGPSLDSFPNADASKPSTLPFVDVGDPVAEILAGSAYTCALQIDARMRCWGWGSGGTLGVNVTDPSGNIGVNDVPADYAAIDFGTAIIDIGVGGMATCVVLGEGNVVCFGSEALGYPPGEGYDYVHPENSDFIDLGSAAAGVCTGTVHSCAVLENGDVYCWGGGAGGVLGYGDADDVSTPLAKGPVDIGGSAVQVACGWYHTCALLDTGEVVCWGGNDLGQLGYGDTDKVGDDEVPADIGPVDVGAKVTQITAGSSHTCAIIEGGDVKCWGQGAAGALGYGNPNNIGDDETPASVGTVDVGAKVVRIDAGQAFNCVLTTLGTVRCWGFDDVGELGYGLGPGVTIIGDNETPASMGDVPLM